MDHNILMPCRNFSRCTHLWTQSLAKKKKSIVFVGYFSSKENKKISNSFVISLTKIR